MNSSASSTELARCKLQAVIPLARLSAIGRLLFVTTVCFVAGCGWSFFSGAELCPFRHQCPALLQKIGARIGRLRLVAFVMGKRQLAYLARVVGAFVCPIPEGGSKAVPRDVCIPQLLQ